MIIMGKRGPADFTWSQLIADCLRYALDQAEHDRDGAEPGSTG
jgi:hypothetical protein